MGTHAGSAGETNSHLIRAQDALLKHLTTNTGAIPGDISENMGTGVHTGLLLKKHNACLWQSSAGPLLKNTVLRQLNILQQAESTDVLRVSFKAKTGQCKLLQGVDYHFWPVISTLQLRFF